MKRISPAQRIGAFITIGTGFAAVLLGGPAIYGATEERPHILFLMADQMRGDCLGADGNRSIVTPNLDRLATEGALFRCAYTSTPSCTPARAAILTGLSPWRHGLLGVGRVAVKYKHELPRMLSEAGYYALGIGKMHYHPQRNLHGFHRTILDESSRVRSPGFRSDYRSWFYSQAPTADPDVTGITFNDYRAAAYALPEELHPTRWTADVAVNFLKSYQGAQPFFLKVSFARPHSPYDPPARFLKMYEQVEVPAAAIGDWASRHDVPTDPRKYDLWQGNLGPQRVREARQAYYGSISFIDEQIGRILAVLAERGMLERTLILFTGDHGDMLGDHHLWRKTYAYEGSARIPLLIRWPENLPAERGRIFDQPVELRDILPTFMDAAGISIPEDDFDGRSLLDLVRGRTEHWRPWIDLEHSTCYDQANYWSALTDGQSKYIFHAFTGQEQLFDLRTDPDELHDLAALPEHQNTLETWRARLVAHLAERGEDFVKDGRLVAPRKNIVYSPNYPHMKE